MKTKTLIVVNPISGVGRQKKIEQLLKQNLNRDLFDYEVCYTEHIHHGTEIARGAADKGYDCVVAVGGDGSVNDVVQGLKGSNTRLGIIPCGSGNGLARSLKLPLQPWLAIRVLNQQYEQTIDSIMVNDQWVVVNAAGCGFDAYIARMMHAAKTRGLPAYTNLVLREYARYKNSDYHLIVDGHEYYRNAWFIAVANSRQFGYNLAVAPKAKLDDGLMDISIIDKVPIEHLPITAPLAFTNHLDQSQHVEMFRAKDLVIEGNADRWVNLDGEGENIGTRVHFEVHPKSVKIYARDLKHPLREIAPSPIGNLAIPPLK
ncbi:MAG: diacylglycerol kinase family lipid kinase [Bacteroidales bacterium]|nr:diacylglycerol kinase family lipid kinase [Bacteroidales bacterium]